MSPPGLLPQRRAGVTAMAPCVPPVRELAIVRALTARVAELEAENARLRERVAELTEYERRRAFDRAAQRTNQWKGLDR